MSGDIYDLASGPRNPHRVRHNGQARYMRELAAATFQPMTEAEHLEILTAYAEANT